MNVQLLAAQLTRMVARDGVGATCRRALSHWRARRATDAFDALHGTDTGGLEPLWKLDIASPNARHGERYEATTEDELVSALEFLSEPLHDFTFIDLGCGKGRTLLVASRLGFRRVIGVEFARELADTARRNLAAAGAERSQVLHADAADWAFPAGDTVVYLYNPFSEAVLSRVLDNLRAARSGRLYVVYKQPRCARLLDDSGFLARHGRPPRAPHIQVWRGTGGAAAGAAT